MELEKSEVIDETKESEYIELIFTETIAKYKYEQRIMLRTEQPTETLDTAINTIKTIFEAKKKIYER